MISNNDSKLIADVEDILISGDRTISHVYRELKDKGWRRLGPLHPFGDMLEELGFRVEQIYKKGGVVRTDIFKKEENATAPCFFRNGRPVVCPIHQK